MSQVLRQWTHLFRVPPPQLRSRPPTHLPPRPPTHLLPRPYRRPRLHLTPAPPLNVYESGQTIPDFPSGIPNVVRGGASFQISGGGNVVITMANGGTVEYSHATYTCVSGEGCGIENGRVTTGTIRVADSSAAENPTPEPSATPTPEPTAAPTPTPTPTATPTRAQSASDRAVLVALYHSTGGANWEANANWLSDRPIGEWHGVTTNSNGRVIDAVALGR